MIHQGLDSKKPCHNTYPDPHARSVFAAMVRCGRPRRAYADAQGYRWFWCDHCDRDRVWQPT